MTTSSCVQESTETPVQSTSASPVLRKADPKTEYDQWRDKRFERLRSETGWLTLAGLYWLKEGDNPFGSAKSNKIVFPTAAPKKAGTFRLRDGKASLVADPDAGITSDGKPVTTLDLQTDESGEPTMLELGSFVFNVIERGDRIGIRLKDKESAVRKNFKGIDSFPFDPKWVVEATFEPYKPVKMIPILDVLDMTSESPSPGALVFQVDGKSYRLDPILEDPDDLFIIFSDQTSGKETYGAGRYVYAKMPKDGGKVIIDFNRSYNPPCVFTPFATCPLPPRQNKLAVRVEAGEKNFKE